MTRPFALAFALALTTPAAAHAGFIFEGFNGGFSQAWDSSPGALPPVSLEPFRPNTVAYDGPPAYSFTTVDGAGVILLNTQNPPSFSRYGFRSVETVSGGNFELEARINTLDQGGSNIDGLFDVWLINSAGPSRYVQVGLFGDQFDTRRSWYYSASGEPFEIPDFAYQSNTWYKLRITQRPGDNLTVSIWNDAGDTKLTSHTFGFSSAALGSEFSVGFSQWMGGPDRSYSTLSAVDYIQVTPTPEPASLTLLATGAVTLLAFRRRAIAGALGRHVPATGGR